MNAATVSTNDDFVRLARLLKDMDYDYLNAKTDRDYLAGEELYRKIATQLQHCARIDKLRTQDIFAQFIPAREKSGYARFVTGDILDTTDPAIRAELLERHKQTVLDRSDAIFVGRMLANGRIDVICYDCSKDLVLRRKHWQRYDRRFSNLAELQHELLLRENAGFEVIAVVGRTRIYARQYLKVVACAPQTPIQRTSPQLGL